MLKGSLFFSLDLTKGNLKWSWHLTSKDLLKECWTLSVRLWCFVLWCWNILTIKGLTSQVNNIDYLVTMVPAGMWDAWGNKWIFFPSFSSVLEEAIKAKFEMTLSRDTVGLFGNGRIFCILEPDLTTHLQRSRGVLALGKRQYFNWSVLMPSRIHIFWTNSYRQTPSYSPTFENTMCEPGLETNTVLTSRGW